MGLAAHSGTKYPNLQSLHLEGDWFKRTMFKLYNLDTLKQCQDGSAILANLKSQPPTPSTAREPDT